MSTRAGWLTVQTAPGDPAARLRDSSEPEFHLRIRPSAVVASSMRRRRLPIRQIARRFPQRAAVLRIEGRDAEFDDGPQAHFAARMYFVAVK